MKLTSIPSPITADTVALSGVSFSNLKSFGSALYFACRDPANAGKSCVKKITRDDPVPRIVTPQEANVRSAVHEYGGGAYTPFIYKNEPSILFTDFKGSTNSLCLCKENKGSDPIQIYPPASTTTTAGSTKTPTSDESRNAPAPLRFADFEYDPIHNCIVCVCEDHTNASKASMVQNSIVSINLECDDNSGSLSGEGKKMKITTLACGNDFYSAPKLSPDGKQLAYVTWNHPNMPWDCTELCVQEVSSDDGEVGDGNCGIISRGTSRSVHGDVKKTLDSGGVSAAEPRWGVTTTNLDSDHKEHERHSLFFLSDASGWYNLYSALPTTEKALFTSTSVIEREADFSDSAQGWIMGLSPYTILPDGTIASTYTSKSGCMLVLISKGDDGQFTAKEFGRDCIPPSSISSLCATSDGALYFIGGSPTEPPAIWRLDRPGDSSCVAEVIVPSVEPHALNMKELAPFFSPPRLLSFPNARSGFSFGYFYPPNNLSPSNRQNFKPPLLVKAHGGPTSRTSTTFRLDIQYWTSRGFAILDVDYGGSTGYGREYRLSLNGNWGVVDIDDVCSGAQFCVDNNLVDGDRLCIDGRSAGGYTTLSALTFRDVFSAGASFFGVSDLGVLCADTHKFESRYLDTLIGEYPKDKAIYDARSPIKHVEMLSCPVILLQGDDDKVVPPNQAEMMFDALKAKGIDTCLVMYQGEQHGFRMSRNIRHCLESEYTFFCQSFGYDAQHADGFDGIEMNSKMML